VIGWLIAGALAGVLLVLVNEWSKLARADSLAARARRAILRRRAEPQSWRAERPTEPAILPSRPGILVAPEDYGAAPALPGDDPDDDTLRIVKRPSSEPPFADEASHERPRQALPLPLTRRVG
jgi:hypothetical protein